MTSIVQRSFAGGIVSPALYGRADTTKYQTGLKDCRNMFIRKHGTAANRAGTRWAVEVKDSSVATYLGKFVFSADQAYAIEIGNLYMRFVLDGGQITVSGVVAWSGATTYVFGDLAVEASVNYYCILGHINQVPPNATYWYALTGSIFEIPTPYVTADIPDLQFSQSNDVVTITHPTYAVRELIRLGATRWTLLAKGFTPVIGIPQNIAISGTDGAVDEWTVTTVAIDTYEESLQATENGSDTAATSGAPRTISWDAVTDAQEYNVYKKTNGIWGFIGVAGGLSFVDDGITADVAITPPVARTPFNATDDYPGTSGYYQQRLIFAGTNNAPAKTWTSRSAKFSNFTVSSPLQADDAVTFSLVGKGINFVRHVIDLQTLLLLTSDGEYRVEGNIDGILLADQPTNPRQIGFTGASKVAPALLHTSVIYVQARGNTIRDLRTNLQATYLGAFTANDLTLFVPHLVVNKTFTRLAYAQIPDSVCYAIRSDGEMLGLTYLPEQEIWGWHRHDTDGDFEDVTVVPEGNVDIPYVLVRRVIDGTVKRYIERFRPRDFTDIEVDAVFMDSSLSYDGNNTDTTHTLGLGELVEKDHLLIPSGAAAGNYIDTPFSDKTDIFDIDIVVRAQLDDWAPSGGDNYFLSRKKESAPFQGWGFSFDQSLPGRLRWEHVQRGFASPLRLVSSTVVVPFSDGDTGWVRVTRENSSGNVKFYTSTAVTNDPSKVIWTQLGTTVAVLAGDFVKNSGEHGNPPESMKYGIPITASASPLEGKVYYIGMLDAYDTDLTLPSPSYVAVFDPSTDLDLDVSTTEVVSSVTGETWTLQTTGDAVFKLSAGDPNWDTDALLNLQSSQTSYFVAGDVGNAFVLKIVDVDISSLTFNEVTDIVTITITQFIDGANVRGFVSKLVPVALRSVATSDWSRAVDAVSGLTHLEGKAVSVIGDGHVVASPNNSTYNTITVASGAITLDDVYSVIHVGLPYISDLQTLDLDQDQSELRTRKKLITHIDLLVESSRGIFAGLDANNLSEYTPIEPRTDYESPVSLDTGLIEIPIDATWNRSGSFLVRQIDPIPLTILSALPQTEIGG